MIRLKKGQRVVARIDGDAYQGVVLEEDAGRQDVLCTIFDFHSTYSVEWYVPRVLLTEVTVDSSTCCPYCGRSDEDDIKRAMQ